MRKLILLFLVVLVAAFGASAHKPGEKGKLSESKKKELQEFKLKFLAEELDLNPDQTKLFNETYTQLDNERRVLIKQRKEIEKKMSEGKNLTDSDYEKANKELNDIKTKLADLETKYDAKFSQFLSKKQIFQLKASEEKFMQKMRECINKKRGEKKPTK